MPAKILRQRPVKGGQEPLPSCVLAAIWDQVDAEAKRHHVSRSFVIATALAFAFDIGGQDDYRAAYARQPRRKRSKPAVSQMILTRI